MKKTIVQKTIVQKTIAINAPAKINLSLRVVGKRDDGYHLLESLIAFTEYGDEVQVIEDEKLSLEIIGEFAASLKSLPPEKNIIYKAAIALQKYTKKPTGAKITLIKNLPVASGIGGGSADAAATIRALCNMWDINITEEELMKTALALGSDIPVCLYGKPAIIRGIGEEITPLTLGKKPYIVLINPNIPLSTAEVFNSFKGNFTIPGNSYELTSQYINDLEDVAIEKLPIIGDILVSISYTKGCYLVNMSGSGATCFGLYHDKTSADNARKELLQLYPQAWCVSTIIQ